MKNKTLYIILLTTVLIIFSCKEKKENIRNLENEIVQKEKNTQIIKNEPLEKLNVTENKQKDNSKDTLIDPFHYGQLLTKYNPKQKDFSKDFLEIETVRSKNVCEEVTNSVLNYNFDYNIFKTGDKFQNGIIGLNYKRIKVFIKYSKRIDKLNFLLVGKTDVLGSVNSFEGKMKIISIFECKTDCDFEGQGTLLGEYEIKEPKYEKHSGIFKGTFECEIIVNHHKKQIEFTDTWIGADGYANRTYVGTWKSYKTGKIKKCIWGDERLPFTFDFDGGTGEMHINKKYVKNGWKSFNNHTE